MQTESPDRATIQELVLAGLREVLEQTGRPIPSDLSAATRLLGDQAVLDSLALVTMIVDLEQRVEEELDLVLTLTDDRAMSQQRSPFRSVGALVAYLEELIGEELGRG